VQSPAAAPAAFVQMPLQQPASSAQESPFWMQNDPSLEHTLLRQTFEQHSAPLAQVLPDVRQAVLRGVHVPDPLQTALQH
jgi:hypothetical protein